MIGSVELTDSKPHRGYVVGRPAVPGRDDRHLARGAPHRADKLGCLMPGHRDQELPAR